jgi:hypothetical protein
MDAQQHLLLSSLITAVSIGIASGVMGSVYVFKLTQPGHILGGWARVLTNVVRYIISKTTNDEWKRTEREEYWLKPVLTCELCVSGQIALWTWVYTLFYSFSFFSVTFGLIFCICQAILTAWLIAKLEK